MPLGVHIMKSPKHAHKLGKGPLVWGQRHVGLLIGLPMQESAVVSTC